MFAFYSLSRWHLESGPLVEHGSFLAQCNIQIIDTFNCRAEKRGSGGDINVPSSPPPVDGSSEWVGIQKRVFTGWCNERLKVVKTTIDSLDTDLCDGVRLIALVQVLSRKMVGRYNKKPRVHAQKMENIELALQLLMKVEKIKIVNIGKLVIVYNNNNNSVCMLAEVQLPNHLLRCVSGLFNSVLLCNCLSQLVYHLI